MLKKSSISLFFLGIYLMACQGINATSQALPTIAPTAVVEPNAAPETLTAIETISPTVQEETKSGSHLRAMLAYLPSTWADFNLPVPFGPAIHFVDIQQLREDMDIGPITGTSDAADKRALSIQLGLNIQGIAYLPQAIQPVASSTYGEWGWDIADVHQILYLPDLATAIYKGDFGRPDIRSQLQEKGYTAGTLHEFALYTSTEDSLAFALTTDILIFGVLRDVQEIASFISIGDPGLDTHPAVQMVLSHLDGVWGAILAPSPDLIGYSNQVGQQMEELMDEAMREVLEGRFPSSEATSVGWDFMAIGFQGAETSTLTIVYHYPSTSEANAAIPLVEKFLTETPSLTSLGSTWSDFMTVEDVSSKDSAVVAIAQTEVRGLIGNAFEQRDFFAFLPVER